MKAVHVEHIVQQTKPPPDEALPPTEAWSLLCLFWLEEASHLGHTASIDLFEILDTPGSGWGFTFRPRLLCVRFGLGERCRSGYLRCCTVCRVFREWCETAM